MRHVAASVAARLARPALLRRQQSQPTTHPRACYGKRFRDPSPATAETQTPRTQLLARASTPACAPSVSADIPSSARFAGAEVFAGPLLLQSVFALPRS